jgi:hypothetical protein
MAIPVWMRPQTGKFLLDQYGGAAAAYSLRRLRTAYTGAAVRVRRSNDNAEANFTPEEITNGTLLSWVGANNGLVVTWFDQSGNGRDATQATAGNQPTIVSSGVLETLNSKPAILWPGGTARRLVTGATFTSGASCTIASVFSAAATTGQYHKLFQIGPDRASSGAGVTVSIFTGGALEDWGNQALVTIGGAGYNSGLAPRAISNTNPITSSSTTQNDYLAVMSASGTRVVVNNAEPSYTVQSAGSVASFTNQTMHIGNGSTVEATASLLAQQMVGRTQELVLWFSDLFGDRQFIRANQRAFYNFA